MGIEEARDPEIGESDGTNTNEEPEEAEKSKRWEIDHIALYYVFSLEQTCGPDAQDISFLNKRKSYRRFDKDFA